MQRVEEEINSLKALAKPSTEEVEITAHLEKVPSDLPSRFKLAQIQNDAGKFTEAIESLLQILAIERNWNERQAYKLLMEIFGKVGSSNEIVIKARKKLSKILF